MLSSIYMWSRSVAKWKKSLSTLKIWQQQPQEQARDQNKNKNNVRGHWGPIAVSNSYEPDYIGYVHVYAGIFWLTVYTVYTVIVGKIYHQLVCCNRMSCARLEFLFLFSLQLLISAPSLGVYYCQQLTLYVRLSVCLSQTSSCFFSFVSRWNRAIFLAVSSP